MQHNQEPATKLPTLGQETIIRFTVDMSESMHQNLSLLAVKQRKSKAELVRFAIAQLLKDMQDNPAPHSRKE